MAIQDELSAAQIAQLRARWESDDARHALAEVLYDLRLGGENWVSLVKPFASPLSTPIPDAYVADLRGVNFDSLDLSGLDFCFVDLRYASFQNCTLHGACFQRANLTDSNFSNSQMTKADLLQVKAHRAIFDRCVLVDAMMMVADFSGSSFRDTDLRGAVLDNSDLSSCVFD